MDAKEIIDCLGCVNSKPVMGFSAGTLFFRGNKGDDYYFIYANETLDQVVLAQTRSWWRRLLGFGPKVDKIRIYERRDFKKLFAGNVGICHYDYVSNRQVGNTEGALQWLKDQLLS